MSGWFFSDCVPQRDGKWLCWDNDKKTLVEVSFKEIDSTSCDPCALKALIDKLVNK